MGRRGVCRIGQETSRAIVCRKIRCDGSRAEFRMGPFGCAFPLFLSRMRPGWSGRMKEVGGREQVLSASTTSARGVDLEALF